MWGLTTIYQVSMNGIASENQFICDRMAGSLCRRLRLLGYDTRDANDLPQGNPKEDTLLLSIASEENRLLLTRDAELSQRDKELVIYLSGDTLEDQIRQLIRSGLIVPELRLIRCSICNHLLTSISAETLMLQRTEITQIFKIYLNWMRCVSVSTVKKRTGKDLIPGI